MSYINSRGQTVVHRILVCTKCGRRHHFEAFRCRVCHGLLQPEKPADRSKLKGDVS